MQILTLLEVAIKQEFLSPNFETTAELLSSTREIPSNIFYANSGSVPVLPWVPDTSAAVALRLLDLDSSISYILQRQMKSHKVKEGDYLVSRFFLLVSDLPPKSAIWLTSLIKFYRKHRLQTITKK